MALLDIGVKFPTQMLQDVADDSIEFPALLKEANLTLRFSHVKLSGWKERWA